MDRVLPGATPKWISYAPRRVVAGLFLFALLAAGGWQLATSQVGDVIRLLAGVGWRLLPPALWLGAGLPILLWLVVVRRAWRDSAETSMPAPAPAPTHIMKEIEP